jgi:hypothetical protein
MTRMRGVESAERYGLSTYDTLIVAAALMADRTTLSGLQRHAACDSFPGAGTGILAGPVRHGGQRHWARILPAGAGREEDRQVWQEIRVDRVFRNVGLPREPPDAARLASERTCSQCRRRSMLPRNAEGLACANAESVCRRTCRASRVDAQRPPDYAALLEVPQMDGARGPYILLDGYIQQNCAEDDRGISPFCAV